MNIIEKEMEEGIGLTEEELQEFAYMCGRYYPYEIMEWFGISSFYKFKLYKKLAKAKGLL